MNAPIGSVFVDEPGHWCGVVNLDMDAYNALAARQSDAADEAIEKYVQRDEERLRRITEAAQKRTK